MNLKCHQFLATRDLEVGWQQRLHSKSYWLETQQSSSQSISMSLIERWDAMSDESKARVKKFGAFSLLLFVILSILRALVPLAIIAVGGYWAYKELAKSS
ncbi:MAG: hypothetical protein AB8B35_05720 [Prochlorococcus sp.]